MLSASECYRWGDRYFSQRSIYSTLEDLTGFQRDLLYVITGLNESHGLALNDELEESYGEEIHHGRLYLNLNTLVDKGLVEEERDEQISRK